MPRFVLLRHDCPASYGKSSHWDLMLERDGALLTWSLLELPEAWMAGAVAGQPRAILATRLQNHRVDYLDYEGPLTANRGSVTRHDAGEYQLLADVSGRLRLALQGDVIRCVATLQHIEGDLWSLMQSELKSDRREDSAM